MAQTGTSDKSCLCGNVDKRKSTIECSHCKDIFHKTCCPDLPKTLPDFKVLRESGTWICHDCRTIQDFFVIPRIRLLLSTMDPPAAAPSENEQPFISNLLRHLRANLNQATERPEGKQQQQKESPELWTSTIKLGSVIKPEYLQITVKNHVMTIEPKEQVFPSGISRSYRKFSKKITIPDTVKIKEIKSILQPDGTLKIEAPKVKPVEEFKPTEIPVRFDDDMDIF